MNTVHSLKTCTKCMVDKLWTVEFFLPNHKNYGSGLRSECRECSKEYHRAYKNKDPDKWKNYSSIYYRTNIVGTDKYEGYLTWRFRNPDGFSRAQAKTYKKRKIVPRNRINVNFSNAIRASLKGAKGRKSWLSLVNYTLESLMAHLERQFTKGMSWDNYGKWHIDHIVPLSAFEFSSVDNTEFKAAWALSNLRPLWAKENISKNNKREFLI